MKRTLSIDANLLKAAIAIRGMTQGDLSMRSGISRATISSICNGKSCAPVTGRVIAEALDVELVDICKKDDNIDAIKWIKSIQEKETNET